MRTITPIAPSNDVSAETFATPTSGTLGSAALLPVASGFDGSSADTHALGGTIAGLAAGLHAATYQLLVLLREFDARPGWNNGFLSCAHWLHSTPTRKLRASGAPAWRTGFDLGASREKVRVARVGAVVQRALEAAADRLFHDGRHTPFSADLDGGTAGDRYQVMVHVDASAHGHPSCDDAGGRRAADAAIPLTAEVVEVDHGALHVSAETSRRISCDAAVVTMRHGLDGDVLGVGRRSRTIPPAIRRALAARDRSCRFPGCMSRRCDAHHVEHWADGGASRIENLVLLCRRHHRAVHEGGFRVAAGDEGVFEFRRPDGERMDPAPPAATPLAPLPAMPFEAPPTWDGTRFDVGWAIAVVWNKSAPQRSSARILSGVTS